MSRNAVLVVGLVMLLGFGTLTQGCGDTRSAKKDGTVDAGKDAGSTGGAKGTGGASSTGGATGTGGSPGTGGATGTGGIPGTGGATGTGGIPGTGGATGTGGGTGIDAGAKLDAAIDGPESRLDASVDQGNGADTRDVPTTTDSAMDGSGDLSSVDHAADMDAATCPEFRPNGGSACDPQGPTVCNYNDSPITPGGLVVCMCSGGKWSCYM
jgi:hypothetical protein